MKKVITAHLGNKMFQIEDDAYTYLNLFLSQHQNDKELEKKVAEFLSEKIGSNKEIITYPDVVEALYQLGFSASDMQSTDAPKTQKKIHRILKDKMIGGVCTGLGDYFEIDPSLLRIVFVIGALFGTLGFWTYIILWIIIPKAPDSK